MTDDPADRDHLTALADLAPQLWEDVVLQTVRDTHGAIADRAFGLIPGAQPVRAVHDGVAGLVYGALTVATRGTRRAAGRMARATAAGREPDLLERSATWRTAVAILNGIIGDLLEEQGNPLALGMTVRDAARDVPLDPDALAAAYPDATRRVAVMVHGLVENDESWAFKADTRLVTYPDVLRVAGVTPVTLRYNSGRHISSNAADLDVLLETLVRVWPQPVEELVLIGHSLGGLVIMGAGDRARAAGHVWPSLTRQVITLGTPHGGAPLEKIANAGSWLLSAVPEMAPFGAILRRRSAGIKDLRHGYLNDEDWEGLDADALRSARGRSAGGIGEAQHHVVGATLGAAHGHAASISLGDLLVRWGSASAAGHEWAEIASITHLGSTDHFELLNHPDVGELLTRILTP